MNVTKNQHILHELQKVKLLSCKEERYTVSKDDKQESGSDGDSSEQEVRDYKEPMMYKKIARFVMQKEAQNRLNVI